MPEALISGIWTGLAVAGCVALLLRLARSVGRLVLASAELAAATSLASASAGRGDLTGMQEGKRAGERARSTRILAAGMALFWLLWLSLPLALELLPAAYAAAVPLWFIPGRRRPAPLH